MNAWENRYNLPDTTYLERDIMDLNKPYEDMTRELDGLTYSRVPIGGSF